MNYTNDIDELIAKHLTGEISAKEQIHLEKWKAASQDNELYFKQMQQIWQQSEAGKTQLTKALDIETALAKTKSKIREGSAGKTAKVIPMRSWWYGLAASLALLIGAFWFFQTNTNDSSTELATTDVPLRDTLNDGSVISLNQYTSLSTQFSKHARRVKMQGEAYFEVAHDTEKPFVIEVKQVEVTVVGTKFNIDGRSDSNKVVVSVEEGKVKVQNGGQTIYLVAGEQAVIDCQNGLIERKQLSPSGNVSAWANHQFVFDDVPLSEVIPILEKAYNARINLSNKELEKCRLHIRFNNEPIDRIIFLLAETFSLEIKSVNGQFYLDGPGCE
jgi:ferric-dicitrate binding protein FerR (iron transport regulator)